MFEMPTLLPYTKIDHISRRPEIKGLFCYIIKAYDPGFTILITRKDGNVGIKVGNWNGEILSLEESRTIFDSRYPTLLIEVMKLVGITQAQFFFSAAKQLVDVQISLNKFLGPGFVRDLFANTIPVQEQIEIAVLTNDKLEEIKTSKAKVILKPSRFRFITDKDKIRPLYATLG